MYLPNNLDNVFENEISNALKTDYYYHKKSIEALSKHTNLENDIINSLTHPISRWFIKNNGKYNFHISFQEAFTGEFRGGNIPCNNYLTSIAIRTRAWVIATIKGRAFSDYFIPLYIAEITFFVGIIYFRTHHQLSGFINTLLNFVLFVICAYLVILIAKPRLRKQQD